MAMLEHGRLLAVIPGWSDMDRGMPGYSSEVIGQTPFGWSLDDAMEGLGAAAGAVQGLLALAAVGGGLGQFQQALLGHLLPRLGPGGHYWDVSAGKQPLTGVTERPPTRDRPYTVLSTVGMSCQRMPVVEQYSTTRATYARIELAVATTLPSAQVARIFLWLAPYPWRAVTWFGPGHSVRWYHEPSTFPLGGGDGHEARAVLLLDCPARCPGPRCRTCRVSRSAAIPCAGCGSSRYRNGSGCSPRIAARPAWSTSWPRSSGAGSSGSPQWT